MSKECPWPGHMTAEQKEKERQYLIAYNKNVMIDTLDRVAYERDRQDKKWGTQDHTPGEWMAILGEEYGEVCEKVCDTFQTGPEALDIPQYEYELIQVAAVCVAAIENIRRQHGETAQAATRATRVGKLRSDCR